MTKPKVSKEAIHVAKIFLSSFTFLIWQKYCVSRSYAATKLGFNASFELHLPTDTDIQKYILPAKTYKFWLKFYYARITLYQYVIDKPYTFLKQHLPEPIKLFLKKYFSFLVGFTGGHLNSYIKIEWYKWAGSRADTSLDIIIFGITSFGYRFQRPQQLARNLAQLGHRVFYIESEFNYALTPTQAWIDVKKESKNIFVVKLSAPHNYFIYQDQPNQWGQEIIFSALKKLMHAAHIINPVAKIDHPFWSCISNRLKMPLIYDAMDFHAGFSESSKSVATSEINLTHDSDLILTSSSYLESAFSKYKQKSIMVRNAGDFSHFSKAQLKLAKPSDLVGLKGKILGYYGAIANWMDDKIIEKLAITHPHDSIVLIGRIQSKTIERLAAKHDNIYLLGEKQYSKLPKYLSHFDVCLIPFKITELIKATNPVKIYEYFASGKPVVTTPIPELKLYSKILYTASSPASFSAKLDLALKEKSFALAKSRMNVAIQNTWEMRAQVIHQTIMGKFYPKVSVVILVYNHANLSQISIDSVLERSKYPNLELIVVDNKSDAETIRMLKTYRGKPHIKVVFNPRNYGFAKGNNVGMKRTSGKYIILLNNDVRVTPGWIERLLYHARSKNVGLVGPITNSIGNESKIDIEYNWDNAREIESKSADYIYAHWGETLKLRNIAAFAWLKSRSVYSKIGGLDERFGQGLFEDDDYCARVSRAKLDILCAEDAFVHHHGGASTDWGSPEFQLLFNTNKAKFEDKWKMKWTPHKYRQK